MEECCRARWATDGNSTLWYMQFAQMDNEGYKHTLRICNTCYFFTATVVTWMCHSVMLCIHSLFCVSWLLCLQKKGLWYPWIVGTVVVLDTLEWINISLPCHESSFDSSVVQSVTWSVCQLCLLVSPTFSLQKCVHRMFEKLTFLFFGKTY